MTRSITLVVLAALATAVGCSRVVTGGYKDSPDGKYRCWIREFGPYNYSFSDVYTLRIHVVEVLNKTNWLEKPLFTKEYRFKDPDVEVEPTWDAENNLTIVLYKYGAGVSRAVAMKDGSPSNHIQTVSLVMDKKTVTYREK